MRHAQRATVRNGAIVIGTLCCALTGGAYVVLHDRTPEIITVVEYRDLPGECVAIDVAAPVPGIPAVLDRLLNRHRRRPHAAGAANGAQPPPLTCAPPEGPVTRREDSGDVHTVPEPATLALMALAVPFVMRRRG